jgi:hypothetical protein
MELEYQLKSFIDSSINEGQLETARNCYILAAESKKITQEQFIFLKRLAAFKLKELKDQMSAFETDRLNISHEIVCADEVDIFEVTPLISEDVTAENVAKVAAGMKYVNDIDAD